MHSAVAARMKNPNLSLYEALCVGGFEYSENDDKSVLDFKQVTLGQRKNQLSRRLRLARKQSTGELKNPPGEPTSPPEELKSAPKELKRPYPGPSVALNYGRSLNISATENQNGTNTVPSKETQARETNTNNESKISYLPSGNNRTKVVDFKKVPDWIPTQQLKRQHITCMPAPVEQPRLNLHHSLCQGWFRNSLPNPRRDDASATLLAGGSILGQTMATNYAPTPFSNAQIANNPSVARYQPAASAVALSSLATTSQTVGLTLDQLALTLSSNTTSLSKLVEEARSGESEIKREQMAINLYQAQIKSLCTTCLLVAGVDPSLAEQNTPTYIKFATKAWEAEGKRLRALGRSIGKPNTEKEMKYSVAFKDPTFPDPPPAYAQPTNGTPITTSSKSSNDSINNNNFMSTSSWSGPIQGQCNHDHDHHSHNHASHNNAADGNNDSEPHDSTKCDSRHLHRIGECGHEAIIHKPKGGNPHIDFIVNGQIECYEGLESHSLGGTSLAGRSEKSYDSFWPSRYKCKEVEGASAKSCGRNLGPPDGNWGHIEPLVTEPKTFRLSDIESTDTEWTFDATEDVDGGVMGLFELAREPAPTQVSKG